MKLVKLITTALVCGFIAGCASSYDMTKEERTQAYKDFVNKEKLESLDKILSFRLYGWSSLGEEHLIISTSMSRPYLITLTRPCYDLDHAMTIKVNADGGILSAKFDSISVPNTIEVDCYIKTIHKLNKAQKKAMLKIGRVEKEEKA